MNIPELSLDRARTGLPTCSANGISLHSRYDPEAEAARFLETALGQRRPAFVLLSGACLDYLSPRIRLLLPKTCILSLQLSDSFRGRALPGADAVWHPGDREDATTFLARFLEEELCNDLLFLEWPPAQSAFPEAGARVRNAVKAGLERLSASAATTKTMGRRWIANAARNLLLAEECVSLPPGNFAILLAAAGPSLEAALPAIQARRDRCFLLAVSSALAALEAGGLQPDLVIGTDGSTWARHHLYPLARSGIPLAAPLTAVPFATRPLLLLNQRQFPELELAKPLGGGMALPPHGTVSGSALALAARLSSGPVIVAGLDLAARGLQAHARPHGFDALVEARESRLAPQLSLRWEREWAAQPLPIEGGTWRGSRSLEVYAAALQEDARALRGRLFRLHPSPVRLEGFTELDEPGFLSLLDGLPLPRPRWTAELPPRLEERERFLKAFLDAQEEEMRAFLAKEELILNPPRDLVELFRAVDYPDWAALRKAVVRDQKGSEAGLALRASVSEFLDTLRERLFP